MQASNRREESAETQIHPGFQDPLGTSVEDLGSVASSGASDAARDGKEMAHSGVSFLLALEVEEREWTASYTEADARSDSYIQQ